MIGALSRRGVALLIVCQCSLGIVGSALAAERSRADVTSVANSQVKALSAAELRELNIRLRQAMALYYDRSYRLALPLLQQIAIRIDTMDLLYWIGHAASQTGDTDLAIEKFKAMLERDPNLLAVRLELAMTYLQKGDQLAAKAELQRVLDAKPQDNLRQQIEQVVTNISLSNKRLFVTARATVSPQYDSNINVGPGDATITLPDGGAQLSTRNMEGFLLSSNAVLDALYDFGEHDSFVWRNSAYLLHNEYPDNADSNFNFTQVDARTALEYYSSGIRSKLPFGFVDRRFASEDLSHAFYFSPYLEYNLTKSLDLTAGYRYEDERFLDPANGAQSNVTSTGTFGPRYRFEYGNILHFLSLTGSYSSRATEGNDAFGADLRDRFSYSDWSIGPSYFARLQSGTELYLDLRYLDRGYDSASPLFKTLGNRADQRYSVTLAVTQPIQKYYLVSASFSYLRNQSNVRLFDYEKIVAGISIGVNFDL